jgi:hypothetical protein
MNNIEFIENQLIAAPIPKETSTYKPISNKILLNELQEELYKRNMIISSKKYLTNNHFNSMVGRYSIKSNSVDDLEMAIAFKNSYNKTMSLGFAAGARVIVCSNGMVKGDISYKNKHQGSISKDLKDNIIFSLDKMESSFEKIIIAKDRLKKVELKNNKIHELIGEMFLKEELCTTTQLGIIKNELEYSKDFKDNNAWCLYNHFTESFKKSNVYNYIEQHSNLHNYFENKFSLN